MPALIVYVPRLAAVKTLGAWVFLTTKSGPVDRLIGVGFGVSLFGALLAGGFKPSVEASLATTLVGGVGVLALGVPGKV